jgi:CheY-like chemotaxis protein
MKVLIAEDDPVSRRLLEVRLSKWGFEVVAAKDGVEAWELLQQPEAPQLLVIDWMMPNLSGLELCQRIRATPGTKGFHFIMLTSKNTRADILAGLNAGADDYVVKPFDVEELRARVKVGERIVELRQSLAERVQELEAMVQQVKTLQGLLPICVYCKKIRNDKSYWQQVESYLMERSDVRFSHGICPDCYEKMVKPSLAELREQTARSGRAPTGTSGTS